MNYTKASLHYNHFFCIAVIVILLFTIFLNALLIQLFDLSVSCVQSFSNSASPTLPLMAIWNSLYRFLKFQISVVSRTLLAWLMTVLNLSNYFTSKRKSKQFDRTTQFPGLAFTASSKAILAYLSCQIFLRARPRLQRVSSSSGLIASAFKKRIVASSNELCSYLIVP